MRVIYDKLSKEVVTVIQDPGNAVTVYPANMAVIEGDDEFILKTAIAADLDIADIPNLNMSDPEIRLTLREERCKKVRKRYLSENLTITIPTAQSALLMQSLMQVLMMLGVGDAKTALAVIVQMPENAFPVTYLLNSNSMYVSEAERKQSYIDELSQIVNELFES